MNYEIFSADVLPVTNSATASNGSTSMKNVTNYSDVCGGVSLFLLAHLF